MGLYRKKPVVIEAFQYDGTEQSAAAIIMWTEGSNSPARLDYLVTSFEDGTVLQDTIKSLIIKTLEGDHMARPGDWIIRGVAGEHYPCKPEIFSETYEPADSQTTG